ncbi:MAG TPA: pyrroloquinoline quinone biosynthesis protein PqqB [Hyphomicrobiales bacterium]|nr:pyrroloquinoline quinone biosynthesis protein PqqB [Hyphomicrobiales bacterium]
MIVKVLGSAAGGGFPQWNCNARSSRLAWDRDARAIPRTQSSIAISADGTKWVLVNASPDIRQQILATPELHPVRAGPSRNSPIIAVLLTNGDIDHIAGLLSLRERQPFRLFAHERVLSILDRNSIFGVLAPEIVERVPLTLNDEIEIPGSGGLSVVAFSVPGKVALYLEDELKGKGLGTETGDTIGLKISAPRSSKLLYIPGCAAVDGAILERVKDADCLLFDGTVFTDAELLDLSVGEKTGRRMGHIPISGEGGSLHAFDGCAVGRKIYVHINTTNPILERGSAAEQRVIAAGWEIAYDGMTLSL